jgi:hypothetical protein
MDCELRYKQHIAKTAAKGLTAALALRRLKMLSPQTARQLFVATVAPVMDYAASVWMHACGEKALSWLNRAQKIGALAITGAFRTVATAVVEAEASILPIRERHARRQPGYGSTSTHCLGLIPSRQRRSGQQCDSSLRFRKSPMWQKEHESTLWKQFTNTPSHPGNLACGRESRPTE